MGLALSVALLGKLILFTLHLVKTTKISCDQPFGNSLPNFEPKSTAIELLFTHGWTGEFG